MNFFDGYGKGKVENAWGQLRRRQAGTFSQKAEILGVMVECNEVDSGKLIYSMKESRRLEALKAIDVILESGKVTPILLPSVLGRLQFADGQLAGRAGKLAMADIRALGLQLQTECLH